MERLNSTFALHPITSDETATLNAMLNTEPTGRVLLMPTHHISHQGDMMGFRYDCNSDRTGDVLPIPRTMFFGHTSSECLDADIMKLIAQDSSANRLKMTEFMEEVKAAYNPPSLACIPDNAAMLSATDIRSMDCRQWTPELPDSIGLYHAYIRGGDRGARVHKLFIVCSGGCPKAADEFCNLVIDMGSNCTASEMAESEEAWWLKRACQRARCRLIKMLADKFGLRVQCVDDVLAYTTDCPGLLAVPATDTGEHDISRKESTVSVHNLCVDTTRVTNGILCRMHPSEGYWMFRGAPRGAGTNGAMFGSFKACGAFPTRSPSISQPAKHLNAVQDGKDVVRQVGENNQNIGKYLCFDEAFFKNLERMQWNRDNGFVELIPIVVGM